MAYSGKRNYKSRREKYHYSVRILKVVVVVSLLFLVLYLVKNGQYFYDYLLMQMNMGVYIFYKAI